MSSDPLVLCLLSSDGKLDIVKEDLCGHVVSHDC